MKKLLFALIPAGCFLAGAACNYRNAANARDAARAFHSFTETMFQNEITSNTLNMHYTLENPEDYGITDYPVTYGSADEVSLVSSASQTIRDYQQTLYSIPCGDLSLEDQITYDILMLALENERYAETFALYREPLGPTIGTQAQLPVLLAEYTFSDREDIEEYLELLSQTDLYFSDLLHFERARAKAGLFMSDENADAIIRQCEAFLGTGDASQNLLVTIFNERTDELSFLTPEERAACQEQNAKAVEEHVLPAYELLAEGLDTLKGSCVNDKGLCYLPNGRAYYEYLLRDSTGSYLPVPAIEKRIRQQLSRDVLACRSLLEACPEASAPLSGGALPEDPAEILSQLQEQMRAEFAAPPAAHVAVKYVHESLEDFLSPAFYLTPPIDDQSENVIYINQASVSDGLELYTTLAHEGYPGHLYQNIQSGGSLNPVRSLFSFGGYTEGWATYVEMESYRYAAKAASAQDLLPAKAKGTGSAAEETDTGAAAKGNADLDGVSGQAEYARLNRSVMLGLSSLLDICIHYHGYTRAQTAEFLESVGVSAEGSADAIYDAILESPANYLKYYLGYLTFLDLREYCRKNWPHKFDLKDFHTQVLRIGPAPFPVVEKYLKRYYRSK